MLNPRWGSQAYDSRGGDFDPSLCLDSNIPLSPGDTLVSLNSAYDRFPDGTPFSTESYVRAGAILNIVDLPQAPTSFRPPYARPGRYPVSASDPLRFDSSQVQWNLLPQFDGVPGAPTSLSESKFRLERPWIDHCPEMFYAMPSENQPWDGREWAFFPGEASLLLMLSRFGTAEKAPLLYDLVQLGIDIYGNVLDGATYGPDGQGYGGRKWPPLFAGIMLDHDGMKSMPITNSYGHYLFQEDAQTYYYDDPALQPLADNLGAPCNQAGPNCFRVRGEKGWIDKLNGGAGDIVLWSIRGTGLVWDHVAAHEHLHLSDWHPSGAEQIKSEAYRRTNSDTWVSVALAARLMNGIPLWNHNEYFDYVDRWMLQDTGPATDLIRQRFSQADDWVNTQGNTAPAWVAEMWNAYRGPIIPLRSD
ncbi:MAG: hypothetical protein DCC75_01760 [Proteobacteria bacterium]|nr:MAG: hypothetical protein DCC75_01760 [Pseudomonadota bacterium]